MKLHSLTRLVHYCPDLKIQYIDEMMENIRTRFKSFDFNYINLEFIDGLIEYVNQYQKYLMNDNKIMNEINLLFLQISPKMIEQINSPYKKSQFTFALNELETDVDDRLKIKSAIDNYFAYSNDFIIRNYYNHIFIKEEKISEKKLGLFLEYLKINVNGGNISKFANENMNNLVDIMSQSALQCANKKISSKFFFKSKLVLLAN